MGKEEPPPEDIADIAKDLTRHEKLQTRRNAAEIEKRNHEKRTRIQKREDARRNNHILALPGASYQASRIPDKKEETDLMPDTQNTYTRRIITAGALAFIGGVFFLKKDTIKKTLGIYNGELGYLPTGRVAEMNSETTHAMLANIGYFGPDQVIESLPVGMIRRASLEDKSSHHKTEYRFEFDTTGGNRVIQVKDLTDETGRTSLDNIADSTEIHIGGQSETIRFNIDEKAKRAIGSSLLRYIHQNYKTIFGVNQRDYSPTP